MIKRSQRQDASRGQTPLGKRPPSGLSKATMELPPLKTDRPLQVPVAVESSPVTEVSTAPVVAVAPVAEAFEAPLPEPAPKPTRLAYKVTAVQERGFWALKRKFAFQEPVIIFVDELTKEQATELESKPRQALLVEVVEV